MSVEKLLRNIWNMSYKGLQITKKNKIYEFYEEFLFVHRIKIDKSKKPTILYTHLSDQSCFGQLKPAQALSLHAWDKKGEFLHFSPSSWNAFSSRHNRFQCALGGKS